MTISPKSLLESSGRIVFSNRNTRTGESHVTKTHLLRTFSLPYDACHEKTDLKVFIVVMLKEGLAGWGPANPSLGMTPTTEYNL